MDLKKLSTFSMICEILYSCVKFYKKKIIAQGMIVKSQYHYEAVLYRIYLCTNILFSYICAVKLKPYNTKKFVEHCWGLDCCLNSCRLWELPITWLPRLSKETGQYIWQAMLRKCEKDISNTKEIKMNGINEI